MRKFFAALLFWNFVSAVVVHAQDNDQNSSMEVAPATELTEDNQAAQDSHPFDMEWYNPEVLRSTKKNRARVRFLGQTAPGTKMKISGKTIPVITKSGKVVNVPVRQFWPENIAQADERGAFEISMDLPFAMVQLPFKVLTPDKKIKNYQLSLDVNRNDVKIQGRAKAKNSPYSRRKWGIWGGLGFNFLKYDQNMPNIPAGIGFQSFTGPALYAKVVRSINREWAAQATINRSPGKTSSSDSVNIQKGDYAWLFLTGEATYFPPQWKFSKKNSFFNEFGVQAGLQYHSIPFFARSSTTDATVSSVETNSVLMAAVGATSVLHYGRYWLFEGFLRYQHPLQSGSLYDIDPKFAFDGSIGVIYKWKPNWRLGGFWYGQWHQYDFKNAPDAFSGTKISGDQSLFFSNLEFRVGYEFD